jgi:tRNA/rRNA methyltransferase
MEVVLVSPRNPLNIGAVARAMSNFGFSRLNVVAPFELHWREARSAVGAEILLQNARVFTTLEEAVGDCTLVVGTGTRTRRKPEQAAMFLPEIASRVFDELRRGGRMAFVFGPEKHGLTREDLACCHLLVEIPTDARQPSMNLGQAVAVCLYELACAEWDGADASVPKSKPAGPPATSSALERLTEVIVETMAASSNSPQPMQDANRHDLQVTLRRLAWTEPDAIRALGLFRRILFRLRNPH